MTVKLAPNAMSTIEILKTVLSIPDDDASYDVFITLMINYASAWVERMTGRSFGLQRRQEAVAGNGLQELQLRHYPIREIHSITVDDSVISPGSYSIQESGHLGVIYNDEGWVHAGYPAGLVPDPVLAKRNVRVDYTAGYILPKDETEDSPEDWLLPYDLQALIWQIAGQEVELADSGAGGLAAFSIADVSWTFDKNPRQSWLDLIMANKKAV